LPLLRIPGRIGTPIIDIKPVMKEFLPMTSVRQAPWSSELMKEYWH